MGGVSQRSCDQRSQSLLKTTLDWSYSYYYTHFYARGNRGLVRGLAPGHTCWWRIGPGLARLLNSKHHPFLDHNFMYKDMSDLTFVAHCSVDLHKIPGHQFPMDKAMEGRFRVVVRVTQDDVAGALRTAVLSAPELPGLVGACGWVPGRQASSL